jgi:hypothetical protein
LKRQRRFFTGFIPSLMFNLCLATSLGIPFMSEGFHANKSRFALRKSTSVLSYLGPSAIPIRSMWSETAASLTSLARLKEQAACLNDSGISWSSDGGSARASRTALVPSQIGNTQHRIRMHVGTWSLL